MKKIIFTLILAMGVQNTALAVNNLPPAPKTPATEKAPATECIPCKQASDLVSKFMALNIKPDAVNESTAKQQQNFVDEASKKLTELLKQAAKSGVHAEATLKTLLAAIPYDNSRIMYDMNSEDFEKAYKAKSSALASKLNELVAQKVMTEAQKRQILEAMGLIASAAGDDSGSVIAE